VGGAREAARPRKCRAGRQTPAVALPAEAQRLRLLRELQGAPARDLPQTHVGLCLLQRCAARVELGREARLFALCTRRWREGSVWHSLQGPRRELERGGGGEGGGPRARLAR